MQTRCRRCSELFETRTLGKKYCPNCYMIEEEKYQQVRELVKTNPGITIGLVAELTGMPSKKILSYVREERLEYTGETIAYLICEDCGTHIKTGRYCAKCKPNHTDRLVDQTFTTAKSKKSNSASKMYTAGNKKS